MAVNDKQEDVSGQAESSVQTEDSTAAADLTFLDMDQSGTVDLDALFDALNIAVEDGGGAVEFVASGNDGGGTLFISGSNLTLGPVSVPVDDLSHQSADLLKSNIVSDES